MRFLLCLTVMVAALVTACGASGVQGKAVFDGGPPEVNGHGKPGLTVTVHRDGVAGTIVATAKTGDDGAFAFDLPPGRYTVEMSHGGLSQTVTVESGHYASVRLLMKAK